MDSHCSFISNQTFLTKWYDTDCVASLQNKHTVPPHLLHPSSRTETVDQKVGLNTLPPVKWLSEKGKTQTKLNILKLCL